MKRRSWVTLGIFAAAFLAVVSIFPASDDDRNSVQQMNQANHTGNRVGIRSQIQDRIRNVFPNRHRNNNIDSNSRRNGNSDQVPEPAREQQLKQAMLQRDITATERLARLDAKGHIRVLADKYSRASNQKLPSDAKKLQQDHKQVASIIWFDAEAGVEKEFRRSPSKLSNEDKRQLKTYLNYARNSIRQMKSYESPSFPKKNPKYFILAEPATHQKHKQGVIAIMDVNILTRVQDHQHKNLRLIPYPKEGKYQMESVHADTLRDMTVKTGHDNEKASHYYENEIVVMFNRNPSEQEMKQISEEIKAQPPQKIGYTFIFHSQDKSMKELAKYFQSKWNPKWVEPHYIYLTNETAQEPGYTQMDSEEMPNDLLFYDYQWNLPIIETNRGWKVSKGSNDIIVAVVDTGVDIEHPDLKDRLMKGYNVIDPKSEPYDDVGHGTHVAGIISAKVNNNEGIAGMMWGGKLLPVKALDSSGTGTTYSVAKGIIWATDQGAKVINLSLGNYADAQFLHEAIRYAFDRDVVLIAATGNDNTERPGFPAAYPEVLSVSATDYNLEKASFSNYGDYVDVMAPGESIASTYPDNQYAALSGTSMASPHVAALAALIRSVNPDLKNTEVMEIIRKNVIDLGEAGHDKYFGYGQIDVYAALLAAGGKQASLQFWPQSVQRKAERVLSNK